MRMDPDIRSPTGRGTGRKRRRTEDEGGEAEDGETTRAQVKLLACPYHKVYPELYSRVKSCKAGYAKIHRLKEHIRRRHLRQRCWRCGAAFKKATELAQHSAAPVPCNPVSEINWAYEQGFDLNQQQKLGFRCQNDEKDWRVLCTILFPRLQETRIPSPYCDESEDGSSLISYVQYADSLRTNSEKLRRSLVSIMTSPEDATQRALQTIDLIRRFEADDVYPGFMRRRSLETSLANSPQSCSDDDAAVANGVVDHGAGEICRHRLDSIPNRTTTTVASLPPLAMMTGQKNARALDANSAAAVGSLVAQAFWRPPANMQFDNGGGMGRQATGLANGVANHGQGMMDGSAAWIEESEASAWQGWWASACQ